ncbi:MAG: DUF6056 family protein [Muribaculaceae bacterium]|nr:DUF6056 family protein [Muribaculaceae bacterium]
MAHKISEWKYTLILSLLFAIFSLMYYLHPYLNDDLWFREPMADFLNTHSLDDLMHGWKESILMHIGCDNGRIAQLLGSVLVILPKWLISTLLSACICICIYISAKLAGVWTENYLLFSVLVLCWVYVMPWPDFMFGIMYSANYIPSAVFLLLSFYLFIHQRLTLVTAILLGLVTSCCHEAFGCALIGGICSVVILFRNYRTANNFALIASALAGIAYLYFLPGTGVRFNGQNIFIGFINFKTSAAYGILLYAYISLLILALIVKSWRNNLNAPYIVGITVISVLGWCLWRTFMSGLRLTWCMNVVSLVGIIYLMKQAPWNFSKKQPLNIILSTLLLLVSFAQLFISLPWFLKMHKEVNEVNKLIESTAGENVFFDLTTSDQVPAYTLGKPNFNVYFIWYPVFEEVYPTSLKNFKPEDAVLLDSPNTIFLYNGLMVAPARNIDFSRLELMTVTFDGSPELIRVNPKYFKSIDGDDYVFLQIRQRPIRHKNHEITGAKYVFLKDS